MSLRFKLILFAFVPLLIAFGAIGLLTAQQANTLSRIEVETLERSLIDARKSGLRSYMLLAQNSIDTIYHGTDSHTPHAREKAREILSQLSYGPDGYFFVYDYEGNNVVHPRQSYRIGRNWWDLKDPENNYVIQDLIKVAKAGGGYTRYVWEKPSIGKPVEKIAYAIGLEKWGWMIGTGLYIDDINSRVELLEKEVNSNVTDSMYLVSLIAFAALGLVFSTSFYLILRERQTADFQLKGLHRRVIEIQEEERGRVARELHDSISQLLISVKYKLELAQIQVTQKSEITKQSITKSMESLLLAISEVRRISRDLRPGSLDDLGLAAALKSLSTDFAERNNIHLKTDISPVRRALSYDGKTAMFRVAQEALTNIERHTQADLVSVRLAVNHRNVVMEISDNGNGFEKSLTEMREPISQGIGLRNMQERMAYYEGHLDIKSSATGTTIMASLPIYRQKDNPIIRRDNTERKTSEQPAE